MLTQEEKLNFFENELTWFEEDDVRKLAELAIVNADEYFFFMPASTTLKYHPDYARKNHGLIYHTRGVNNSYIKN